MTDILDLIDQATSEPTASCWHCARPVAGSVSDDFCSQDCQTAWHAARSEPLVGYREPTDVAAHYSREPALGFDDTTPGAQLMEAIGRQLRARPPGVPVVTATNPAPPGGITYDDVVRMYRRISRAPQQPRSFRFTQQQWDEIRTSIPGAPSDLRDPTGRNMFTFPIELVDRVEDSTPHQYGGLADRALREVLGESWWRESWRRLEPPRTLDSPSALGLRITVEAESLPCDRSFVYITGAGLAYGQVISNEALAGPNASTTLMQLHRRARQAQSQRESTGGPWLRSQITPPRLDHTRAQPLLVFALNYPMARHVAERELGLNSRQWRYVGEIPRLLGLSGGCYHISPSFWERADAHEMLVHLRTRRMHEVTSIELEALRSANR